MTTDKILELRKRLYGSAEASMQEYRTKQLLMDFVKDNTELKIRDCGSWFYAVREGSTDCPPIAFRADYDAVVCGDGTARHLCGHDGHSAALAAFAAELGKMQPDRTVYLIFQPGEETGEGGRICSSLIREKGIGEIYGFHNIPGFPEKQILLREQTFACASTGMEITLQGSPSHAAYPEQGVNPALLISELIRYAGELAEEPHKGIVLATVIGAELGSSSYGVSAEKGVLRLTLRAERQEEYDRLLENIRFRAEHCAARQGMTCTIRLIEEFPATVNHRESIRKVKTAAEAAGCETAFPGEPFRWSEDFGYYLQETKGAIFGVGAGVNHPGLHTEGYEFNDALLEPVVELYKELLRKREDV